MSQNGDDSEIEPSKVTPPEPTSGYDDTIHVVLKTNYGDYGGQHTRVVAAFRDEVEARACADRKYDSFATTRVECVGLTY